MRVLLAAVALTAVVAAQPADVVSQFERRTIESNGVTMSYGLFVPEGYDPALEYPLVVAFHGLGESGTDLVNLERHRLATSWADPARQAEHPAFVLAPQTLVGRRWTTDRDPDDSEFVEVQLAVLDILDLVEGEFSIDADRVYAVGLSLGGHATWDFVSRLPDRFAAAVPMSGRGFPSQADDLGDLPIWAFTGEADSVVPPSQTRRVVQALEDLGRDVVYTHCRRSPLVDADGEEVRAFDCPGPIGLDSLGRAVDAHASLIYTSEPAVRHGPWAPWFDHPLLADWLFGWERLDPDAVAVAAPGPGATVSGPAAVTWTSARTGDAVEVWVNPTDDPAGWRKLGEAPIEDGTFALGTAGLADAALARVRLFVRNADGRIVGQDTSGPFAIDNAGNAAPELRLRDEDLRFDPALTAPSYDVTFVAADAEGDALGLEVYYSTDGGATYALVADLEVASSPDVQTAPIDVAALPNSAAARFRVDLSDGTSTVSASTAPFAKQTPRGGTLPVARVQGDGAGSVEVRVVDESVLTGHRYRIVIDDPAPGDRPTTFSVVDLEDAETVLAGVPFSDGTAESPVFDGLAVVVRDLEEGRADLDATGWVVGDTDLGVAVSGGTVRISVLSVDLLATEDDYELTIAGGVVGRSVGLFNVPQADTRFAVTGSDGQPRDVVFVDQNGDGLPGNRDVVYIVEDGADGGPALAWKLAFSSGTVPPEPGDVFRLVPVRSLSVDDVFEFEGRLATDLEDGPGDALGLVAYPNPSAGDVTLAYTLASAATVRLEVFDALGRLVQTVQDGPASAGTHAVAWSADAASGVFLVRLSVRDAGGAERSASRAVVVTR